MRPALPSRMNNSVGFSPGHVGHPRPENIRATGGDPIGRPPERFDAGKSQHYAEDRGRLFEGVRQFLSSQPASKANGTR